LTPSFSGKISREKKIDINIIKEKYGILFNIHGIWHHKNIILEDIIIDQHLIQIGDNSTMIHGIKGKKIM
jgi:hypothetical protein